MLQPDSSLIYVKKSLKLAKKTNYNTGILDNYLQLSKFNNNTNIKYADSALQFIKTKPNLYNIENKTVAVLSTLGGLSKENKNYLKAKKFLKQALDSSYKYNDNYSRIHLNNEISHCYLKLNLPDSAKYYLNKNLNDPLLKKNKEVEIRTYQKFGNIEESLNNYSQALYYFNKSINLSKKKSNQYNVTLYYKADLLNKLKRFKEAQNSLGKISNKYLLNNLDIKKEYHYLKYIIFNNLKNQDSATYQIDKHLVTLDSINKREKIRAVSELETKYETQQKENKILKLSNENIKKEAETELKKNQLNYALFGGGAILLLSLFTLQAYQKEKKSKKQVVNQKREIETLHKELHHRVKNNLGIAKSFTKVAKRNISDSKGQEVLDALQSRIVSMANIHELLYQQENVSVINFQNYTERICDEISKTYNTIEKNITYSIDASIKIPIVEATPLGLILNEAITNSYKHAFKLQSDGIITIVLKENSDHIFCTISDNGIGIPSKESQTTKKSYGMELIHSLVMQLSGTIDIVTNNGTLIQITMPKNQNEL